MNNCLFFRVLSHEDKGTALADAVAAVRSGGTVPGVVHAVDAASFEQIPGSPFAYWISRTIRSKFTEYYAFEGENRSVRLGLSTKNDARFVRAFWEVPSSQLGKGKRWSTYANGGTFSPFYCGYVTVVLRQDAFRELSSHLVDKFPYLKGNPGWILHLENDYSTPCIGWPLRTHSFSPHFLPAECVFSARTYATYVSHEELPATQALLSSKIVDYLLKTSLGRFGHPEFVTGVVRCLPWPGTDLRRESRLGDLGLAAFSVKQDLDSFIETSRVFRLPAILCANSNLLAGRAAICAELVATSERKIGECRKEIDEIALRLYGISPEDRRTIEDAGSDHMGGFEEKGCEADQAEEDDRDNDVHLDADSISLLADLISYCVGCALGRWDIRFAIGSRQVPKLPGPFAPLPVSSPGSLTGPDALPAREAPAGYPLRINWDGILVDDSGFENGSPHQSDIVRRVQEMFALIWGDRAEAIEQEACEILGVKSLRDYFHKPGGFFADHLKQYSKSRRQAPIYWPVSTASGSYTLWIYYHRLNKDLLYKAVNEYVNPKISETDRRIAQLEGDLASASGRQATVWRGKLEEAKALRGELEDFKAELLRVAGLPYKPDLNDGVLITASPLWRLFRLPKWRKDLEACWKKLEAGEYDWAHLAFAIWPDRVRETCKRDRSIAIAHDLEDLYEKR